MRWWARLLRRDTAERELDAELRYDFDRRVEDFIREGLSVEDARRAAHLEFGGLDQIKERCRDARGTRWLEDLAADARHAFRLLGKDRSFAAVAIVALGLGIAVNNTQFTIVEGYCIRGLPIDRPDQVAYIGTRDRQHGPGRMSYADFADLRRATTTFDSVAAYGTAPVSLADSDQAADSANAVFISVTGLRLLGRTPALGRDFQADDADPGAVAAVILASRVWQSRYHGDPSIVGRAIRINGAPGIVAGVMPEGFTFPSHADLWMPLEQMPGVRGARRDARNLSMFGRLRDGSTLAQAQTELDAIGQRLAAEFPATNAGILPATQPINTYYNGRITDPAWIAFTVVGVLVVVIACANVTNLLLMRSAVRAREIAMRSALGATRGRIVRQLLVESAALAALAAVLGLALSAVGMRLFIHAIPAFAMPFGGFSFNVRVLGVLAAVTLGTVFVFGLLPAFSAARTDVNGALKTGALSLTHDRRVRRWTTGFLTVEFGLTVLLVSAVGLTVESFRAAQGAAAKIDRAHLLTLQLAPPQARYGADADRQALYERVSARFSALPGVAAIAFTSHPPLGGALPRQFERAGDVRPAGEKRPVVGTLAISPEYFATLGLPLARGRGFDRDSVRDGAGEIIVNERFVHLHFPDRDPVGQRIRLAPAASDLPSAPWLTIVGVAPDIRQNPPVVPDPLVYLPFAASLPARTAIIVKTTGDPAGLAPLVREQLRGIDADLPVIGLQTLRSAEWEAGWNARISQNIITTIASIALMLAAVGLYAVTAYGVAQRRREIGIRLVLGAGRRRVMWLVLRGAFVQVFLGFGAGFILKAGWARLFGGPAGSAIDTSSVAAAVAILTLVALAASAAPVLRASRVDPVSALRAE
jgi:putative ABC transport system permease protein